MPHRAFCNLKYHVGICVKKYISAYACDSVRDVNGFEFQTMPECTIADGGQCAVLFKSHIGHSTALIECIGVQSFDTGGDGNAGQTPAVTKRTPADGLQRRILLEGNGLQIGVSEEAELTNLGNSVTNYKISNSRLVILGDPCGISARRGIIRHHAITVNLQRAVVQQNVLDIGAAVSGIDDGCIIGVLKRALFGEVTGVAQYIHLAADSYTIGIKEVDLGINRHFTGR